MINFTLFDTKKDEIKKTYILGGVYDKIKHVNGKDTTKKDD